MPTTYGVEFNGLMSELASTGEAGVLQLTGMLNPPGEGSNAKIEYALSGLSHWVSVEGREAQRLTTSNAYIKALGQVSDREIKAFIIRELQLIGKQEAVAPLTTLLSDEYLKEPAREALAEIEGNALPRVTVGESELAPFAVRAAALSQKMAAKPSNVTKLVKKALKDDERRYRFAALDMASAYAPDYGTLVNLLGKAQPEKKADILNWLGDESDIPGRRQIIAPLAVDAAVKALNSGDLDVTDAAARLLAKIGGQKAISALTALLGNSDAQVVEVAASALTSTGGDISSVVAPAVAMMSSDAGKIAAVKLLAGRKSTENFITVFGQLSSESPEVRTAAYEALKDVVTATDLPKLYPLMDDPAPAAVLPVQQALVAALGELPAERQYSEVMARMNAAPAAKQYVYYPVLASTGNEEALMLITERFDSESGAAKDSAFDALVSWEGTSAANKLLAICEDPAGTPYFDRAISQYTTIAADPSLSGGTRAMMLVDALEIARTDAQKRAILTRMATTGSNIAMAKAGDYLDYEVNNVRQAAANAVMTIALGNPQFTGEDVKTLLNKVSGILDNADADYQRQAIRQHLDAMP
jgi:HEAT repeat protein